MNLENIISQYKNLLSFEQINSNKWQIISPNFRQNGSMIELFLCKKGEQFYLTDDGYALINLDVLVDISSKDVVAIIKEYCDYYNVSKTKDDCFKKVVCEDDFLVKLSQFVSFINILENMHLFFN